MERELDHVGRILEQWRRERPDLDPEPMGLIGRIHRIAHALQERIVPVLAEHGLREGEFDLLSALRRAGTPYELSPSQLAATTMVTSGAVTKRLDRLEERGLVTRRVDAEDGRARAVALTVEGRRLIDAAIGAHVANEESLIAHFSPMERTRLAHLLEEWARELGD